MLLENPRSLPREPPIEPIWYLLLKCTVFRKAILSSLTTIGVQETKKLRKNVVHCGAKHGRVGSGRSVETKMQQEIY